MKKVLLIEDNLEIRENTAEILELANYDVLTAENGKLGVALAKEDNGIDLIICDIMMPELDGYGVLHILNKNPDTAKIPFIFLTAKAERSDMRKGMSLGADDYLTKPFDDTELLDAVEIRLKKSEQLKTENAADFDGLYQFMEAAQGLADLKNLSIDRKVKQFKKKSNIYWESNYANSLIFINSGKVKTFKTNTDGKELITGLYSKGDFIGFNALVTNSGYSESAEAMEDVELCHIPKEDFFKLLYSNRDVAHKFIEILSNALKEKEVQMLHLAYNSVRQRVAEALLNLKNQSDKQVLSIPRDDLASIVGTAQESVIRTLSDFKEESLIEINSGKITLINEEKLERLADKGY